ncbi:MAG: phenylalanine--tRNA ligase beta subunit-related protein [Fermentimonas sp.]|nr:phenylalanine--tRNA ligase beta subunit-related protein [Fermentimonas sp.]
MKLKIEIGEEILEVCPGFHLAAIYCNVKNTKFNENLWIEIDEFINHFSSSYKMADIKKRPAINATREVYKKLGKDPNRYRPSGEALCRRLLNGQGLYQIDTLVDLINLVSLKTGYSIGGFDADKIEGDLRLGVGKADEPFEAIGRGTMNIEGLPVYRDSIGGIGNPSSDEERTKITPDTTHLLMLINGYSGREGLDEAVEYSINLLKKYAYAEQIKISLIICNK